MAKKLDRRKMISGAAAAAMLPAVAAEESTSMKLGAFSVSLAVKNIQASRDFYEKLGFTVLGGNQKQNWLVMRNAGIVIGLFQGMFDKNILTFNPGWDQNAKKLPEFSDIRDVQKAFKAKGLKLTTEADEKTKGPASFTMEDPDGNQILFDQHV